MIGNFREKIPNFLSLLGTKVLFIQEKINPNTKLPYLVANPKTKTGLQANEVYFWKTIRKCCEENLYCDS